MTEKEEKITNYMSSLIGTSIEKMENNAMDMLKFTTGIITLLTGMATFLKISIKSLILPLILLLIGIVGYIRTIEPAEIEFTAGEVESCVKAYNSARNKKRECLKVGYYFSYLAIISFMLVILNKSL